MASETPIRRGKQFDRFVGQPGHEDMTQGQFFFCPLCRRPFDRDATGGDNPQLTLAHIIPQSLGGTWATLACAPRNNGHGHTIETDLLESHRVSDWVGGRGSIEVRIPELIGNRSLIANDECDECNVFFSETVEDSLGKMLSPLRTLLAIPGKKGVPTQQSNDKGFRMEYDKAEPGFSIRDTATNRVMREDIDEKSMSAELATQPFVPVRVLKCLAKMALAIMPEANLAQCKRSLQWVRSADDSTGLEEIREGLTFLSLVPFVFPRPMAALYQRFTAAPMPAYVFVVSVSSLMLQSYVPFCTDDESLRGGKVVVPRLGHLALDPEGPTQWDVIPVKSATLMRDAVLHVEMKYDNVTSTSPARSEPMTVPHSGLPR